MADPRKMSVEEMLAAARRADGKGGDESTSPEAEAAPKTEPTGKPQPAAAKGKKPGEMSVAEMLAAARAEKSGGDVPAATEKPAAAAPSGAPAKKPGQMSVAEMLAAARSEKSSPAKPAAKPAGEKPTSAKPAAAKATPKPAPAESAAPSGPKDTASILAAARKESKPGPMSKAEAAAKGKTIVSPAKQPLEVPPMPAKPAYARTTSHEPSEETRRGFFSTTAALLFGSSLAIGFSSLAITNLLWVLGLARFMFPNVLIEPPTKFTVGFPDNLAPGQVEEKYKAQFGVWIVRYEYEGQPQIYALKAVCTHLGCTPNWLEGEQKFKCPCHGSGFYKDGINFEGPAPRPLERYAISLADDGQLQVDKSQTFNEELGQWKDSASYVLV